MDITANDVITFWFEEIDPKQWFKKDDDFDRLLTEKFQPTLRRAVKSELFEWRATATGRLAEVIVLDQFARNIYRGNPEAFTSDPLALALAQEAVSTGADTLLPVERRSFLYMPYMHSESLVIHDIALELFKSLGQEVTLNFEIRHRDIIEKFGRYPHRNEILGREPTQAELDFLAQPGSSF